MTSAVSENGNPFPGLRSFEREHSHLFFGRDEQIKELVTRLNRRRFLPIVGMSGSGKSSLVRAGLIPALTGSYVDTETSGWRIATLRPGRNAMHELAATLGREFAVSGSDAVLKLLRGSSAGLARFAQQHLGHNEKLLLVVDQFEELFRYPEETNGAGASDDDVAFVKLLLAGAGVSEHPLPGLDNLPVYVVTTMRSDFLGKCSRFRGLPEALNQSQYLIPRLTRAQQHDVIEGPIGMAGASIDPELVQRLLNDLSDNPDQLPALQHALMRTWEHSAIARAEGKPITVADYEAIGGMADALNRDADRVYEPLAKDDKTAAVTRRLFQRLVQPGAPDAETRSPTPLSELVAITGADETDVKRVIGVFQERGFLTVSHDKDPIVDITHESLIRGWRQLTTWVQEESRSAVIYRRLADTAALYVNREDTLLVDPQLQSTLNWREESKPNEAWAARYDSRFAQAMEFLEQSRKEHYDALERQEQQRRSELKRARLTAVVLGTFLLLAIGATIFAFVQWRRTQAERDRSSRLLYDSNVYAASSAIASGQSTLARQQLSEILDAGLANLRGFEWFYLWRAAHAEEATLSGHSGSVRAVAVSPDGQMFASGGEDKTVKLWDTVEKKEVDTLSGHSEPVLSVAFSPNGKTLASGSADRTVKLWDIATRKEIVTFPDHYDSVRSVAFSPDGKTLVSATDGLLTLWDIATGKQVGDLPGHHMTIWSIAFAPDGKTLASASSDLTVMLWDIAQRKAVARLSGHSAPVLSVAFSPDGKTLASASGDKLVKLWDVASRKEIATLSRHASAVWAVAFSPDGKTLASGGVDKTVKLWDVGSLSEVATLSGHSASVVSVAFTPDGRSLTSASIDQTLKLWNVADRNDMATLTGHSGAVTSLACSRQGQTIASASRDGTVKLWDVATRKEVATLPGKAYAVAFSPDGNILASAGADVMLWDIMERKELATFSSHSRPVLSITFSPDGKTLASGSADRTVKLWDVATRKEVATLPGHSDSLRSVAFSSDGKTLATASDDGMVKFWDPATHKELATLSGDSGSPFAIAFSPDGKTLASGSADRTVKLWDIAARKEVATLSGHSGAVLSVAFSPDGKTLASASYDNTVKLWDIATRKEVATLSGHSGPVWSVAFSPDGKTLASTSDDKTVRLWFAATEQEVEERRRGGY